MTLAFHFIVNLELPVCCARPAWKNAEHPLRTDPHLKLTGIPTLLKCNMETGEPIPGKRLGFELEQCKTGSEVENLVQGLIA